MKKLAATLLAVSMALLGTVQAHADRLQEIIERGVIRIGTPLDTPPFGFVDADRNPTGFDVEFAQLVADALGVELELQQVTAANRVPYLFTDKVDVIISNLGYSPERAKQVLYTSPYINTFIAVWGPADLEVTSAADVGDNAIALGRGTTPDLALTQMNPDANLMRTEDDSTAMTAFLTGQAPLLAANDVQIEALKLQNPGLDVELKFRIRNSPSHMAVQMDQHNLLAWLNSFIFFSLNTGDLNRLNEKYLGRPIGEVPHYLPTF
ncbi:transporter substrate-binding domain-containing protein [Devosia naphthalenivorans]|jgi:polar amino acid transport system substrate-binding protein|uniref:transporter substrate-binding domain-containing protein n=1 Tax=Devosia naphthalenivorans TaxID=2082392 RepID=UPI000D3D6AF9|nr:transporter substrate-binding domain-containing protein [Devosia naphthalenivorans]